MNLLTHNDLDGVGCAVVLKYFMKNKLDKVWNVGYNKLSDVVREIEPCTLFVTDLSLNQEDVNYLSEEFGDDKLFLVDHHEDSYNLKIPFKNIISNEFCGTKLLYNKFIKSGFKATNYLHQFVTIVNDYDMWIHNNSKSMLLNDIFYEKGFYEFFEAVLLNKLTKKDFEEAYIKRQDMNVKVMNLPTEVQGRFRVVVCDDYSLINTVSFIYDEDYIFIITGEKKLSVRAKVDCRKMFEEFEHDLLLSKGGHKTVGGFNFKEPPDMLEVIDTLIELQES